MGLTVSKSAFEYFNDVHIAVGSGLFGVCIYLYRGLNTENVKTMCVGGFTMACILYGCSSVETITVTPEKIVFISGCDSGLGFSLAQHACDLGFTVLAGCLSMQSDGARELEHKYKKKIFLLDLDLTKETSIRNAVIVVENFIVVNEPCEFWALVNNAGVMVFGEFEWLTERLLRQQVDVNLYGTISLTKALLPVLRKYSGRIITISSHCAKATLPGLTVYGATKAALAAWCDGLRIEQKKYGVSVITFIPGSFVAQSNIMSRQNENVFEMQSGMTKEQLSFYGEYFKEYNTYLSALSGKKKPKKIQDFTLYEVFNQTLLDKYPSATYVHESWKYKLYHMLFRITPYYLRDRLIVYFIQMPKWKHDKRIKQISNVIG